MHKLQARLTKLDRLAASRCSPHEARLAAQLARDIRRSLQDPAVTSWLDRLTTTETALATYPELLARCLAGYVPTIHPNTPERIALRLQLQQDGARVWP